MLQLPLESVALVAPVVQLAQSKIWALEMLKIIKLRPIIK
jgi:hypothetical protein